MGEEGILYSSAERAADSKSLVEAQVQFSLVLKSVYAIEDAELNP